MKRNVPDERLRESVGEALGAVTFTYSRAEGQDKDKVRAHGESDILFRKYLALNFVPQSIRMEPTQYILHIF